jgi:hypothetical protein
MKKIFTSVLLSAFLLHANSQDIVISQVYGGGGNSGATYTHDFIELFNRGTTPVSLDGWSVQYSSATGTAWQVTNLSNFTLQPGQYYLVQQAQGTGGTTPLPTPDVIGTIAMGATAGKVALVNNITALSGACPATGIIDFVGFGATANCFEGTGPTPAPSNTTAVIRGNNGCLDNNDNATDFTAGAPNPRNSSSTFNPCSGGSPTLTPAPNTLPDFGSISVGNNSTSQSFSLTGANLTGAPGNITITAPSANFQVSNDNSTWGSSTTVPFTSATLPSITLYARFTPQTAGPHAGNISISGGGASATVAVSGTGTGAQFTPGNLVIYRVGDGIAPLSSAATAVFLDEYTTTGALAQSIPLPTVISGSNKRITASGTATSEGLITRSIDGQFLLVSGYDAAVGTASITGSAGTTINRVVGRIDNSINIDATTGLTDFASASNPRSVISTNGTDLWVTGGTGGVRHATLGATTSTQLSTTVTNLRQTNIFDNQLYISTASGTAVRLGAVGTGLPTTSGQTITNLPGFPSSTGSPYGFFFADLDAGVPGNDVVYVADDGTGTGFQKYSLVGGNWVSNGNIAVTGNGLRGITGSVIGSTVTLYGTSGTNLFQLIDASGYNATISGTVTTLATAPTNTAFRGVAFVPVSAVPPPMLTANPTTLPDFGNINIGSNSASQSFNLSGTNLTGAPDNITITAPSTDFQVSNDNNTWGPSTTINYTSATLPATPVYVRFTPQSSGPLSGNVSIAGGGASAITVAVSGTGVVPPPPVLTAGTLADFGNVTVGTQSASQSFNLSGTDLTGFPGNITITAPSTDFEVSNDNSTWGPTTTIPYTSATLPSTPVYARFTPQSVGPHSGNISISGGGASTTVAVSGTGTAVPIPSLVASPISGFGNVIVGTSSASQTSNITGTDLAGAPGNITITAPSANFEVSNDNSTWGPGTTIPYTSSSLPSTPVYIRFSPQAAGPHAGDVSISGGGASTTVAVSGTGVIPTLTTTALTAFGNVCINTTAGPNSFTITGTNLSNANVTVSALAGYTYSTTAGGTYSASLSLPQPGGSFSQQIFVRFNPTAVQSYSGNIVVGGGGASSANVAASGDGVNTAPSVTTGAASSVMFNSATAAGSITANGCTAITAYGIEYSTVNGFPDGTGTQAAASNLSGGNFSSNLTGLAQSTTYYYKAYATNAGGTTYGVQQSFTTPAPPPVLSATSLSAFGAVCINTSAGPNSFTITGINLNNTNINVGPLAGYTFATSAGGTYSASLNLVQPGGSYNQQVFVKFDPTAVQSYNGNIPVSGGGASAINVAASGSGINTLASVTTGAASDITTYSATLSGSITATGCSSVTAYGFEYSGINGFANGTGTNMPAVNLSGGNFSAALSGLVQGATYYYKAYATNNGGTAYGSQQSFTVQSIPDGFKFFPVPATRGTEVRISMNNLTPGNYVLQFIDDMGRLAYQKNIHLQAGFINQTLMIPGTLAPGVYRLNLVNNTSMLLTRNVLILP